MNFFAHFPPTRVWYGACRAPAIIMKSTSAGRTPPVLLVISASAAARSRQLLRSFHNKSLGDKDSLDPTVYDPFHEHMLMTRRPDAAGHTKVSLTSSAALATSDEDKPDRPAAGRE